MQHRFEHLLAAQEALVEFSNLLGVRKFVQQLLEQLLPGHVGLLSQDV